MHEGQSLVPSCGHLRLPISSPEAHFLLRQGLHGREGSNTLNIDGENHL